MPSGTLRNVKIAGIACAVPTKTVLTSEFYNRFGEQTVKKFEKMTGIRQRQVSAEQQTSSDFAFVAAERLLKQIGWDKDTIDGLIFVTQTPDYRIPSTACVLHKRLGLNEDCIAFDINLGCSGYVYGIQIAAMYLQNKNINRILLLTADTISKTVSTEDKSTAMLFGDAGAATAIESCDREGDINYLLRTRSVDFKAIIIPSGAYRNIGGSHERKECGEGIIRSDYELYMNATDVFNFTIEDVPKAINEFKEKYKIDENDVDMYVLHQANIFMLKAIAKRAGIPIEKIPISIDRYGNTSLTSIPLTICDACMKIEEDKELRLICSGFGVGFSLGMVSIKVEKNVCRPIIYTDDFFRDGRLEINYQI